MPKDSCTYCGGMKDTRSKMCSSCRFLHNHPRKGTGRGWTAHSSGYVIGYFFGTNMAQHREVMSFYLGRPLEDGEVVHHINSDKSDNHIENLELMTVSDHHRLHASSEVMKERSKLGHQKRWSYSFI